MLCEGHFIYNSSLRRLAYVSVCISAPRMHPGVCNILQPYCTGKLYHHCFKNANHTAICIADNTQKCVLLGSFILSFQ